MASLQIFNNIQGHRVLVEYKGFAGDVVLINAFAVPLQSFSLRNTPLGYARGVPLTQWRNKLFSENISSFQMLPTNTARANSNGIVHWLVETSGISAGATLKVESTTLT